MWSNYAVQIYQLVHGHTVTVIAQRNGNKELHILHFNLVLHWLQPLDLKLKVEKLQDINSMQTSYSGLEKSDGSR